MISADIINVNKPNRDCPWHKIAERVRNNSGTYFRLFTHELPTDAETRFNHKTFLSGFRWLF